MSTISSHEIFVENTLCDVKLNRSWVNRAVSELTEAQAKVERALHTLEWVRTNALQTVERVRREAEAVAAERACHEQADRASGNATGPEDGPSPADLVHLYCRLRGSQTRSRRQFAYFLRNLRCLSLPLIDPLTREPLPFRKGYCGHGTQEGHDHYCALFKMYQWDGKDIAHASIRPDEPSLQDNLAEWFMLYEQRIQAFDDIFGHLPDDSAFNEPAEEAAYFKQYTHWQSFPIYARTSSEFNCSLCGIDTQCQLSVWLPDPERSDTMELNYHLECAQRWICPVNLSEIWRCPGSCYHTVAPPPVQFTAIPKGASFPFRRVRKRGRTRAPYKRPPSEEPRSLERL